MSESFSFTGGAVLTPDGVLEAADVHVADGRIVDTPSRDGPRIDCRGRVVLPAIVDVHGDAFELEIHPRPGVDLPLDIAMGAVDRQLVTNGIATAFHGLTISWEPGARGIEAGRTFMDALPALRPGLTADHRVQLRWETFAHAVIPDIAGWLRLDPTPAIAFNDHTTLGLADLRSGNARKLDRWAQRAGVSLDDYIACLEAAGEQSGDVAGRIGEVAAMAARHDAVMLSHDEQTASERRASREIGMRVCEFPLAREVAAEAVAAGEHVVMGAPNVIRGGSHTGAMSAEDAVRDGLCTVLASDYHYPSLLHAAERLVARGVGPLAAIWALVSANPAASMGLDDRGAIEPCRRADIIVLDCSGPWRLVHTVAGGVLTTLGRRLSS